MTIKIKFKNIINEEIAEDAEKIDYRGIVADSFLQRSPATNQPTVNFSG